MASRRPRAQTPYRPPSSISSSVPALHKTTPVPSPSYTREAHALHSTVPSLDRGLPPLGPRGVRPIPSDAFPSSSVAEAYRSSPPVLNRVDRQRVSLRLPSSLRPSTASIAAYSPQPPNINDGNPHDSLTPEDADALNEIIMAIEMKDNGRQGSTIGCAYYVALEEKLYLLDEVRMAAIDLVETLLLHTQPTTILVSSRASEALVNCLRSDSHDANGNRGAYILRTLNSVDFRYEGGKNKLLALNLGMNNQQAMLYTAADVDNMLEGGEYTGQEGSMLNQLMRLGTSINLDSRLTIGCAGAVLGDIQRRRTAQYLPNDPDALVAFCVQHVETFSLFNSLFVNADTLASLQILRSEHHPNSHRQGPTGLSTGDKESLSVYGLFCHLAVTPQGKIKLRRMFLQPSIDFDLIRERQRTLQYFIRPGNAEILEGLTKDLRTIKDMKYMMILLRKGVDNPGRKFSITNSVWAVLQRFAAYSLQVRESLRTMLEAEKVGIVRKVVQIIDVLQIRQVGELITETIDFEQSGERGRTAVKQGVDAELDERKRNYDGMEHFLANVITSLRHDIPEWAGKYVQNCIFFPQLGFLTVVSTNPETGKGNYEGEGLHDVWERMFIADGSVYYKNRRMKELDAEFGDAYCMILDREIEIIYKLAVLVLQREDALIAASDVLGELDSLLAMAIGCAQYKWTAPKMSDANILYIEGGRHPLQELVVSSFISNDCFVAGGEECEEARDRSTSSRSSSRKAPSTIVLTGPNHSGKSVYLKQVAIIVYLSHIGCFVPAEHAEIGLTDRILTRVATRESVARNESAFAIDLRQVAFAINFVTPRSLILIDEFGKGTNSQDGAGLMAATIEHFTGLGSKRPKLLIATHFHEILDDSFLSESEDLAFAHMEIHVDCDAPVVEDQVAYLYQFKPGRSISSFGSRCAAMNGIDPAVVERAEAMILHMARHEDLEVVCSKLSDAETRKLKQAEEVARAFLQEDFVLPPLTTPRSEVATWYRDKLLKALYTSDAPEKDMLAFTDIPQ
ncbi:muts domain V-domain-containing protein [Xylariaceae sp. FL0255]|nr:muts domain V-domain-containing protein [Xylariaceae sp. FL0255]